VAVNNGALTALDPAHDLTIAVTDISGEVSQAEAGTLEANLRGLLNGVSTRLQLSVDDVARLREKGSPADITLEGADSEVILSGRLGLADLLTFDGAISAQSPDVRKFLGWFGLNITGFEVPTPLGFDSGVSLSQSRGVFTNMALALGNQQAKGMMDIQAAAPRPRLKADLAFNMLDLNLYRGKANAKDQPTSPPDLNQVWSEAPRTLADLKALDADVTLTTDALKVGALQAGATTLKATLQEGALAAQLDTQAIAGGTATLNLGLAAADNPDLKLVLKAQNVESREFLGNAFGLTFLEGPVSLDVDVNAKGQSTAQWISTLAGTASVTAQDVSVNGLEVARLAGLLTKGDAEGWGLAPDSATLFAKANASAAIADGITTLQETKLQSEGFGLALEGTVDLLRQAVDLTAKPSAGNTLKLPVSARIKGPWRKPKMSTRLDAGTLLEGDLRDSDVEDIAKAAGKQAKKALKKILGD
jgi:AsmA protein